MLEAKKNCEENDVAPAEAFHQFSLLFNAKRKLFPPFGSINCGKLIIETLIN